MKTKRKALLLSLCAVLLVVASVMGTMAYLTSTDEVKNTFIVGNAVKIDLDEADVDENGTPIKDAARVKKNDYKLMPGHSYTKDPTVHVDSTSEQCYVFVTVSNGISGIEESTATGYKNIATQITDGNWNLVNADLGLYVYAKGTDVKTVANAGEDLVVFNNFTVKSDADISALQAVKDANITIKAYAVQVDGFENMTPAEIAAEAFGLK